MNAHSIKRLLLSLFCLIVLGFPLGCDRAFTDVGEATIEVVSPDLSVATDVSDIQLELKVESVREVTRVRSNSIEFAKDAGTNHWIAPFSLKKGLNQIIVEAFVDDGPTRVDTLSLFHLTYSISQPPSSILSFITGSHTVTVLLSTSQLLVGGSFQAGETAALDTHQWTEGDGLFKPIRLLPSFPRVGHTATLLPDGSVIILGGAVRGDIETTTDLISFVERYDPTTSSYIPVPFAGEPIRRMYHTAVERQLGDRTFIVLLGGRGDTQYLPEPLLGIREDMRTFEYRNDSLIALSPAVGPFIEPLAGHTQIPLSVSTGGSASRFLVSGLAFDARTEPASFIMDFGGPFGIDISTTRSMNTPRIRHAGVNLAPGIVALFGGRGEYAEDVLGTGEIFVESANLYFTLPFSITPRFGLTATKLRNGEILLLGGFDATSNALSTTDFVSLSVQ